MHNYTADQLLELLLKACLYTRHEPKYSYSHGICAFLLRYMNQHFHANTPETLTNAQWRIINITERIFLNQIAPAWPKHSKRNAYPVPHPHGGNPVNAYCDYDAWSGAYGQLRMELLDFTIETLRLALKKSRKDCLRGR